MSCVQKIISGVAAVAAMLLGACASTPEAMNNLTVGMSKTEVTKILGQPQSVASHGGTEFYTYSYCVDKCLAPPVARIYVPFFVRFERGTVDSFGRKGDFDSTKNLATRIEIDRRDTIRSDVHTQDRGDLYTELKKLKELLDAGIITQEEFDTRKKKALEKP